MLFNLLFIIVLDVLMNSFIFTNVVMLIMLVVTREMNSILIVINHGELSILVFFCALIDSSLGLR